jgi:hypothetical protein
MRRREANYTEQGGQLSRYSKHLLTSLKLLLHLFRFIQRTGRFHAIFGDFKELPPPDDPPK